MKTTMLIPAMALATVLAGCSADNQMQASFDPSVKAAVPNKTYLHQKVTAYAHKHRVPPALAHGVVKVESRYNCGAVNRSSRATGIMQVLPRTAKGVGVHGNLRDCATGLEAGMRYLRQAYEKSGGDWCLSAHYYNAGLYARAKRSSYCRMVLAQANVR